MAPTVPWPILVARLSMWALACAGLLVTLSRWAVGRALRRPAPGAPGRSVVPTLVRLGPTFVKSGQLLSTRSDLLSPASCAALAQLTDRMAAMPAGDVRRALAKAYPDGRPWPFAEFDYTAVASGSIAGVYRARLHDGQAVAVKVRRPGLDRQMVADFRLLGLVARMGERMPGLRGLPAQRMIDQVGPAVLNQLDLAREAVMLERLRLNLGAMVRIPATVPDAAGEGVLVMEFLDGLERFGPASFTRDQRSTIVKQILRAVFQMLFIDGLVHCDMHPGNLYLRTSGEVVLLDAGFVVELSPRVRKLFAQFFLNLALGRPDECVEIVLRSASALPAGADLYGFRRDLSQLVRENHGKRAGQFRLGPFAARLFDLQRRNRISADPEFVFPLLSLLVLEGMINDFDVQVDFQAQSIPALFEALRS
ncbi:ABC1 kinase family protein [Couchioplanes caeruleus]|nr:AarF/UbiB family protein [Couchioplanes caeruleus]ROP28784.1 ubiquinone biosynthesis protein [Couchioplanes caeruleus]